MLISFGIEVINITIKNTQINFSNQNFSVEHNFFYIYTDDVRENKEENEWGEKA